MKSEINREAKGINHQGLLPMITQGIGIFLVAYATLAGLVNGYVALQAINLQQTPIEIAKDLILTIFLVVTMVCLISIPGYMIGVLFPRIKLSNKGFEYRFLLVKGKIRHEEIVRVVRIQKPFTALAIVIDRPLGVVRGLWLAKIHGRLIRVYEPVILISGNLEKKKELEQILNIEST